MEFDGDGDDYDGEDGEFDAEGYDEDYEPDYDEDFEAEGFEEDSIEATELDLETDEAIPEEDIEIDEWEEAEEVDVEVLGPEGFPEDDEIMEELRDEWDQDEYDQHLDDMARAELGIDGAPEDWKNELQDEVDEELRHEMATKGDFKDPGWAVSEDDEEDDLEKERDDNLTKED